MKKTIIILALLGSINSANAIDTKITGANIVELSSHTDKNAVVIKLKGGISVRPICNLVDTGFLLEKSHVLFDEIFTLALSAQITERKVNFQFSNVALSTCDVTNIKLL
jgi:hypothetical protein